MPIRMTDDPVDPNQQDDDGGGGGRGPNLPGGGGGGGPASLSPGFSGEPLAGRLGLPGKIRADTR